MGPHAINEPPNGAILPRVSTGALIAVGRAPIIRPMRPRAGAAGSKADDGTYGLMSDPPPELLIECPEGLLDLVEHLRDAGRFAFDSEFVSEETFEPVLGLIQVATRDRLAVVDPLAIGDVGAFWDVLTDPGIEVVMHAAGEDLRICKGQTGRLPARVVDVQIAAGLAGFSYPLSHSNLTQQALGISLPGGETRTDWRRRPLSPAQLRYALDDVRYLLDVADSLDQRLDVRGRRAWAEAEYRAQLESIRARDDEDRWRRLPGLHHLSRRGLEAARRLYDWRRDDARRSNRPLRQVMRDDLLVAIARRLPTSRKDLEALRDFNRPHLLARSAEILRVLDTARQVPAESLPEHAGRHDEGPGLAMVVALLTAALNHCCTREQVAFGLVGSASDLRDLVRWYHLGRPEDRRPDLARGWRETVCGSTLIDVLAGRQALRISDPAAEVPVDLVSADGLVQDS